MLILKCDVVIFFMMIDKEPQLSSFCKNKGKIQVCLRLTKRGKSSTFPKFWNFCPIFNFSKNFVKMKGHEKKSKPQFFSDR